MHPEKDLAVVVVTQRNSCVVTQIKMSCGTSTGLPEPQLHEVSTLMVLFTSKPPPKAAAALLRNRHIQLLFIMQCTGISQPARSHYYVAIQLIHKCFLSFSGITAHIFYFQPLWKVAHPTCHSRGTYAISISPGLISFFFLEQCQITIRHLFPWDRSCFPKVIPKWFSLAEATWNS